MNFGSKFVYVSKAAPQAAVGGGGAPAGAAAEAEEEAMDTNVLAVKFDVLQTPAHMQTGDVSRCKNGDCKAVLSHISKLTAGPPGNAAMKVRICRKNDLVYFLIRCSLFRKSVILSSLFSTELDLRVLWDGAVGRVRRRTAAERE